MAKRKKAEGKKGLDEWMATYSDMVTLLMCFFVLLYSSSTPDETKFQYIFQAFNSSGSYINPFVDEENEYGNEESEEDGNSMVPESPNESDNPSSTVGHEMPENFDNFSAWFATALQGSEYAEDISVEQTSSTRICIRFNDSIMFAPNSAELLDSGREAVSLMLPGIKAISEYIKKIEVSGHTAAGVVSNVNDWDLSAARACSVLKYMDYKRVVESECYIAEGRGQYSPFADNSTEEGRAQNRRVEIVLIRNNIAVEDTNIIQDILTYDYGINQGVTDPFENPSNHGDASNSDAVDQIITGLEDKYNTTIDENGEVLGQGSGPEIITPIEGIPDSALHEVDEEGNIITAAAEVTAAEDTAETEAAE